MLGPILGRDVDRHSSGQGVVDHLLIDAFGMKIDFHLAAALGHAVENGFPKIVAAFVHAAFAMSANGYAADGKAGFQNGGQCIAAIRGVIVGIQTLDGVIRLGTVVPMISVAPDAQLKIDAAAGRFVADEFQHRQVFIALFIRQIHRANFVARHLQEKRIGEIKIRIANVGGEIVTQAEREVEAIEPFGGQHGEIVAPEFFIAIPGQIFHVAGEQPADAADGIGGAFDYRLLSFQRGQGRIGMFYPIGRFQKCVSQAAAVAATRKQRLPLVDAGRR